MKLQLAARRSEERISGRDRVPGRVSLRGARLGVRARRDPDGCSGTRCFNVGGATQVAGMTYADAGSLHDHEPALHARSAAATTTSSSQEMIRTGQLSNYLSAPSASSSSSTSAEWRPSSSSRGSALAIGMRRRACSSASRPAAHDRRDVPRADREHHPLPDQRRARDGRVSLGRGLQRSHGEEHARELSLGRAHPAHSVSRTSMQWIWKMHAVLPLRLRPDAVSRSGNWSHRGVPPSAGDRRRLARRRLGC